MAKSNGIRVVPWESLRYVGVLLLPLKEGWISDVNLATLRASERAGPWTFLVRVAIEHFCWEEGKRRVRVGFS